MPNLNEFIKPETPLNPSLEKIDGIKPCKDCNKDSAFYYWNPSTFEMSWTCPDGHINAFKVNN